MTVIYVASDKPGSGKTALSASLCVLFNKQGLNSAVYKLTSSEAEKEIFNQHMQDFSKLLDSKNVLDSINLPEIFTDQDLIESLKQQEKKLDVLILEAPSSQTPDDIAKTAKTLNSSIIKIVNYSPSITIDSFQKLGETFSGIKFSFLINNATKYSSHAIQTDFLEPSIAVSDRILGVVPENRALLGINIDTISSLVDGQIIDFNSPPDHNHTVNHFMVGGWSLDAGELYFGLLDRKAAIIKGDRPDMQMAALSTDTSCLILTGGSSPNQYVVLQAEDKGVPIIVTNNDTVSTMELLNKAENHSRFDHPEKLGEFLRLIEKHVDTNSIFELV